MPSTDRSQAGDDRDPAGADRATPLERRGRWLLRAYPAQYRRERGEEILGTLLETTPAGRAWPRARDIRGLAVGGLRARAAVNRRLSTAANLRIAVMAGISLYLILIATEYIGTWVIDPGSLRYQWPFITAGLILVLAVLLAWIAPRMVAALFVLAAAVAIYIVGRHDLPVRHWIALLVSVAAVVLLAPRSERQPRKWLMFIGAFAASVAWVILSSRYGWASTPLQAAPLLTLCLVSVAWLAIDARLTAAIATLVLTFYAEAAVQFFNAGALPYMFAIVAIAALPVWLLQRQSAPRARSR
jgi:hypothetical protein